MQRQLSDEQKAFCLTIANLLRWAFAWNATPEGNTYWTGIATRFRAMAEHGTTDGMPWVDPNQEQPLTDEDAKKRPWVMMRDDESHSWQGPARLLSAPPASNNYVVDGYRFMRWKHARKATESELKQAGITK